MKRTLTATGLRQLIAFISRMTAADRAELEGVSAERAPQIVAGALVAEASMRALAIDTVDICPWALREGLILRKLDSEADGTALVETSVGDAGPSGSPEAAEATHDDRTRRQHSSTRPISVAELLAKNGTIGAPPVGGRRRRRRGNTDAVTVAELTGEIPIVTDGRPSELAGRRRAGHRRTREVRDDVDDRDRAGAEQRRSPSTSTETDRRRRDASTRPPLTDEEADYAAHIEEREASRRTSSRRRGGRTYEPRAAALSGSSACRRRGDEPRPGRCRRRSMTVDRRRPSI